MQDVAMITVYVDTIPVAKISRFSAKLINVQWNVKEYLSKNSKCINNDCHAGFLQHCASLSINNASFFPTHSLTPNSILTEFEMVKRSVVKKH